MIQRIVDPSLLEWPSESDLVEEDIFARGYIDVRGATWEDVCTMLEEERKALARPGDGVNPGIEIANLNGEETHLDLGVGAAVFALSAANCAPISSCSGGPGHHERYPLVAFYCRKGRVRNFLKAAELADCGLVNGAEGALVVYAEDVGGLLTFAETLVEMKDSLKPLSRPHLRRNKPTAQDDIRQLTFDLAQGLPVGESVDVVVSQSSASERRSAVDILAEAPGGLVFKAAADVVAYLKEEKEAWGRCATTSL